MAEQSWMNNPDLENIDPNKLELLMQIVEESRTKKSNELIPYFIAATANANSKGIAFNDNETELILSVLKERMSKEDLKKIDTIRKLSKMISKKEKKTK